MDIILKGCGNFQLYTLILVQETQSVTHTKILSIDFQLSTQLYNTLHMVLSLRIGQESKIVILLPFW